jgi:N-glycosylase/DNA lyase
MERGALDLGELSGGLDLQATLESGQSYCWDRADGRMYATDRTGGGTAWYHTVVDGEVIRARQVDGRLEWESTTDAVPLLTERLRLDDDLPAIRAATPDDDLLDRSWDAHWGLRLVADPPFRTLVSFVCSARMRVDRIHGMQRALAETYGEAIDVDGATYHAFPGPEDLAAAPESELRDLSLGYRAPYVRETAEMVAHGEADPAEAAGMAYEDAREWLTRFVGVGQKVADCVCLFSLGHLEAVPLDTWIRSAIADHYPDCDRGTYAETSRAIRERLGGAYAGYAQTYAFHFLRTGGNTGETSSDA